MTPIAFRDGFRKPKEAQQGEIFMENGNHPHHE